MRKNIMRLLIFIFLFFSSSLYAMLNLELTKGVDNAIPIAVVPFEKNDLVSQVIQNDLTNSGEFKIFDVSQLQQFPHDPKKIDFDYFRSLKVDDLIVGDISEKNNQYDVQCSLLSIYQSDAEALEAMKHRLYADLPPLMLRVNYSVNKNNLRRLAHKISDQIYQKLTGEPGIFSTHIAYVLVERHENAKTKYFLMVTDADGYNPRPIVISTDPIMSPAWSPDGKNIVYVSFENRRASIYMSNTATGQRHLISQFPGVNGAPAFSPGGQKLAIVLSQGNNLNLNIFDLKTHQLKPLTHGWSINTEPAWSPDGKSIIFTSDQGGSPQIYEMDLKTLGVTRLTYSGNYNARASFTPDGKSIVMLHRDSDSFGIAIQDLASGVVTVLANSGNDQSPSVSSNGKMIIYASQYEGQDILSIVSTDGRVNLRLPENQGEVREPVWSPLTK